MDAQSTHPEPVQRGGWLTNAPTGVSAVSLWARLQQLQLITTAVAHTSTVNCCMQGRLRMYCRFFWVDWEGQVKLETVAHTASNYCKLETVWALGYKLKALLQDAGIWLC